MGKKATKGKTARPAAKQAKIIKEAAPFTKPISLILGALTGICVLIFVFVTNISIVCFDRDFYTKEYQKDNVSEATGMGYEDLSRATDGFLEYLEGTRDSINTEVTIKGETRPVFNEREESHMVDVRALYWGAKTVSYICAVVGVLLAISQFALNRRYALTGILRGYLIGNIVFFAILAILAVYAISDFNTFWTSFHQLFFTNDLWLLDPATDLMIVMLGGSFFYDLVIKLIGSFLLDSIVIAAIFFFVMRSMKKKGLVE